MPVFTESNRTEIAAGAGALPVASPDGAAPAVDANPGYRDAMIAALPSHAAAEKVTPENYEAWKAARIAKIDADTSYVAPDPAIAAEHARAEAHAIAIDAKPADYQFEFPASFTDGAKDLAGSVAGMREFAAKMQLPVSTGRTLLEHLAGIASRYKGLNEAQATAHRVQAEAALAVTFGSAELAAAKVAEAKAALGIAKDDPVAAALANSLQLYDPLILAVLVGHGQRHALFQKGGKK